MIPKKYEQLLFGFLLSGLMSLMVSGISTAIAKDWDSGFLNLWMSAWITAWTFAFPAVLFVAPLTRRIVRRLITQ